MHKIITTFIILFAALSLKAQSVSGIRIDGGNTPILVYFGGTQMCLPATSCFVAHLNPGYYTVEVFSAGNSSRPGERVKKEDRLFSERVYFNGNEVKEIIVDGRNNNVRPDRPGHGEHGGFRPEHDRPNYNQHVRVMDNRLFQTFLEKVKQKPFKDDRLTMISTAMANSDFTSGQCLQLAKIYTFDDDRMEIMKLMYPRIVDKESFFMVIDALTFDSSKKAMEEFMLNYGRR